MKNNTRFSICLLFLWMSMSFCLAAEATSPAMTDAENEVENEDINVMTVTNHVL